MVSTIPETSTLQAPRRTRTRRRKLLAYGGMARRWFVICLAVDLVLTAIVVFVVGFGTYYQWRQEHPWLLVVTIGVTSLILFRSTWRNGRVDAVDQTPGAGSVPAVARERASRPR